LPLPLSGYTGSNRWQLDSKTEKVTSLFPGRSNLTNKWVPKLGSYTYYESWQDIQNDVTLYITEYYTV